MSATAPIWLEQRWALERAALVADPVWWGRGVPRGDGQRVLLIPGLFAGDWSLLTMARWLRRIGYEPLSAGIHVNGDCAGATVDRLAKRLREEVAPGERITLIGQSRGGMLARALAVRESDRIGGLITLGSPLRDEWAINPVVRTAIENVARIRAPGTFTTACLNGACCSRYESDRTAPLARHIGFVSVYTRSDGVVNWRACLDPSARAVEVTGSHAGMGASAPSYRAIAAALVDF